MKADLVRKAVEGLGGLDILVSNAGRQQQCEDLLQLTTEAFDATLMTSQYAPFWIIKAALPHLQPGSCVIATTSEQAYDPAKNYLKNYLCRGWPAGANLKTGVSSTRGGYLEQGPGAS